MAARRGSLTNHCEPKTLLCVCSNMWLTVVCLCKQLLLSCVCNWVTTLVLPPRPREIATAATICAVPFPLARRCLSCRIPWHGCHPSHRVACVFALWVVSYLARHHIITGTWSHTPSAFEALNFQPNTMLPFITASCN